MNPVIPVLRELKNIVNYDIYNVIDDSIIDLDGYANMTYYDNFNIFIKLNNTQDMYPIYIFMGGRHLQNILYVLKQATNIITQKFIDECIELMNNQDFRDHWNAKTIELNVDRFMNTLKILDFTIENNNKNMYN